MRTTKTLVLSFAFLAAVAGGRGLASDPAPGSRVLERGWAPWVLLASDGKGPSAVAVPRLESGASTLGAVLNHLEADEATRAFFSKVIDQLESMDLEALYETLPEPDGPWRRVRFTGHRDGEGYRVATIAPEQPCACVPDGALGNRFGDLAVVFRSRPATNDAGEKNGNFVGDARIDLGLGEGSWVGILAAIFESFHVTELSAPEVAKGLDPAMRPKVASRAKVVEDNPRLGPEDVEGLAVFYECYPRLYEHLKELYRVDDILIWDPLGNLPYRQIRLVVSIRREVAKETYPDLYEFLDALGPLARGRIDVLDDKGRTLFGLRFNTKDLQVELDAFVKDGMLLPADGGNVLVGEPVDIRKVTLSKHRVRCSFAADVNGIVTEVRDLDLDATYRRGARDAVDLDLAMSGEPAVSVSGSAFGIVPTWAIDVFIPGNLQELTRAFFRTLAKGNDGRGLRTFVRSRRGQRSTVVELGGEAEGLNNGLIRLGFKIARHKLIPGEAAVKDIARSLRGAQAAFTQDLSAFAAAVTK
jgi:hypothetical protein